MRKFVRRKCEKLCSLRTQSASKVMRVSSIITDEEIVETGKIRYVLPRFHPHIQTGRFIRVKSGSFNFARRYSTLIMII